MTLHVGLIAPEFPPDIGGVESYSYGLAGALAAAGITVTLFTRHDRGIAPVPAGCDRKAVLRLRRRQDRALLASREIDAWHVTNAAYAWLALEDPRPVVVSVHGNDFLRPYVLVERPDLGERGPLWRWRDQLAGIDQRLGRAHTAAMLRRALPRARRILSNSRYTEAVLLDRFPACRGLTTVAWVGVGDEFLSTQAQKTALRGRSRLITVSRLSEPRKNVDRVLRALAPLAERHEFTYTVIGDGADAPRLEALALELGIAERSRFLGQVEGEHLREELSSSGLFVLTSSVLPASHEGFGIAYLEANACGTPVLAARSAGAAEAVAEGVSGFFVEEPTVEQLSAALDEWLAGRRAFDPGACRSHAEKFTWARVADSAAPWYWPHETARTGGDP